MACRPQSPSLDRKLDGQPREAAATPRADAPGKSRGRRSSARRWWRELLVVVWLAWVYDAINNLAPLRLGPALAHGRDILSLESSLGIAPERALDHWLAAASQRRARRLRLLRQRALRGDARGARAALVARRRTLPPDAQRARRDQPAGLRRLLALSGRAAAHARRLHRRRRLDPRDRLLAHRGARLAGKPARGDALAAHRLGAVVHGRRLAAHAPAAAARARASCIRA